MSATTAPAKIQALLDYAISRGMVVSRFDGGWELRTQDPTDRDRIWIYWDGGKANGGRTGISLYRPHAARKPSRMTKQTFQGARSWIRVLTGTVVA